MDSIEWKREPEIDAMEVAVGKHWVEGGECSR